LKPHLNRDNENASHLLAFSFSEALTPFFPEMKSIAFLCHEEHAFVAQPAMK
jgi:hypothetical protein